MRVLEIKLKETEKDNAEKVKKLKKQLRKYNAGDEAVNELVSILGEEREKFTSIKNKLKEISEVNKIEYPALIKAFLSFLGEKQQKIAFESLDVEDLKAIKPKVYFPMHIMKFEGIVDIPKIDIERLFEKQNFERVENIYFRAERDIPLLIIGESGTSKDLMARAIHKMSKRSKNQYLKINCASIPETLIASELFGHEKGAFTGATTMKKGILEQADKGTLFLDELAKMPMHLQANFLTAIEEQKIRRVGGEKNIEINVRILAAAHPSDILESSNRPILFDLLYRLGYPDIIKMPSLNQRFLEIGVEKREDILKNSVRRVLEYLDLEKIKISERAMEKLFTYQYKGNYREFESILRSSIIKVILERRNTVTSKDLIMAPQSIQFKKADSGIILSEDIESVFLKDFIAYANKVQASLVEEKIRRVLKSESDIKRVLIKKEGLPRNQYQNYLKKLTKIMGKGIKEIKSNLHSDLD